MVLLAFIIFKSDAERRVDFFVVWMANGENGKLLGQKVMRGLARIFGWPGFGPKVQSVVEVDPVIYARYEGQFRVDEDPDWGADIILEGDRLFWQDSPNGLRYELYPASETVLFALERPEEITFVEGSDGSIEAVMIGEYLRLERVS